MTKMIRRIIYGPEPPTERFGLEFIIPGWRLHDFDQKLANAIRKEDAWYGYGRLEYFNV